MRRIKGTHVPRLALAFMAVALFFASVYGKMIGQPIDYSGPVAAAIAVGFLFAGVLMLVTSWVIGLENRAEIFITLLMIGLHIVFDTYILVTVFIQGGTLPVALVQLVVQAYWLAGVVDVLLMYGAQNWEQTASDYTTPEQRLAQAEQEKALLQQTNRTLEQRLTTLEQRYSVAVATVERTKAEAERTYSKACVCGWVTEKDSKASAQRSLNAHIGMNKDDGHHADADLVTSNGRKKEEVTA